MKNSSTRKTYIGIFTATLLLLSIYMFYKKMDQPTPVNLSQKVDLESKRDTIKPTIPSRHNEPFQSKRAKETSKNSINLEKVIDDATNFQSFIYPSLPGVSSNAKGMGHPMDPVFLVNYMDSSIDRIIVPFAHGGQVISLAFMRSSGPNEYKPGQLIDVSKNDWTQYPPLSSAEAEQIFSEQRPLEPYERVSGLYHLGHPTPFYQYKSLQNSRARFLVNAVSGTVTEAPTPSMLEEQTKARESANIPPIRQTDDGLIEIIEERAHNMSSRERMQLEREIVESNKAIEQGLLKIGPNFEVIYDKR